VIIIGVLLKLIIFYIIIIVSSEEAIINGTNELQSVPLIIGLQSNYILGQYLEVNCTMPSMIDESFEHQLEWFIYNEKVRKL
jgi:hypothetical protein